MQAKPDYSQARSFAIVMATVSSVLYQHYCPVSTSPFLGSPLAFQYGVCDWAACTSGYSPTSISTAQPEAVDSRISSRGLVRLSIACFSDLSMQTYLALATPALCHTWFIGQSMKVVVMFVPLLRRLGFLVLLSAMLLSTRSGAVRASPASRCDVETREILGFSRQNRGTDRHLFTSVSLLSTTYVQKSSQHPIPKS